VTDAHPPSPTRPSEGAGDDGADWAGLKPLLRFRPEGGVDWTIRPFAKRWSYRKLGPAGIAELLESLVPLRNECWVATAEAVTPSRVREALSGLRTWDQASYRWWIDRGGRWLAELAPEGSFSFEFVIPDPPALRRGCRVQRLRWQPPV
jgi:hypothetical protein